MNVGDCDGTACGHNVCKNGGTCSTLPDNDQDFSCDCIEVTHPFSFFFFLLDSLAACRIASLLAAEGRPSSKQCSANKQGII